MVVYVVLNSSACNMLQAIFRPWRLAAVLSRLNKEGIRGATVSTVRGVGAQSGANWSFDESSLNKF